MPLAQVRRQDRAVEDEEWIREMLRSAATGCFAMAAGGRPYLNTNLFVYDSSANAIYFHTASEGRTPATLAENPSVCFIVSEMGRLLPAKSAAEMSVEYASVIAFGRVEPISDPAEAERALRLLLEKYFPHLKYGEDYSGVQPADLERTTVYRLRIEQWSGKRKRVDADFPGAFTFERATPSQE